ncbi:MAG: hypothetical protein ACSW8G_06740, partial [Bacillota bacterium]
MDSIKYIAKGHSVEFSKRELTIDGKVYSYTGISQIKHSSAYHAYLFRYNGEWVKLFYEEPQGKMIATLFKRIRKMNERRLSYARATQSIDTSAIAAALEGTEAKAAEPKAEPKPAEPAAVEPKPAPEVVEPEVPETVEPEPTPVVVEPEPAPEVVEPEPAPAVVEPEPVPEVVEPKPAPEVPAEEPKSEEPKAEEKPEEPKTEEKPEEKPAEKKPEEKPAEKKPEEKPVEDAEAEIKKAKRKKAIIIFAIILALFVIAGIIYFLTIGPTTDASISTNVDDTHQY